MAKQIAGLCFFEGTIDDLTFYQMDGQYYCRAKSCLTSERVKTSPKFKRTMISARRMACASKIGGAIYKALPPRWRQFWMYRSFTGEAFTLLKHTDLSEAAITAQLYACYVAEWDARRAADPDNAFWLPVPVKIRKRRVYSAETLQRRWDAMRARRSRREIREEKRQEAEARREAWRDARAAAAAKLLEDRNSEDATSAVVQALAETVVVKQEVPKRSCLLSVGSLAQRRIPASTRRRRSSQMLQRRSCWHIDQHGSLYQQPVPAITHKEPTSTQAVVVTLPVTECVVIFSSS